MQTIQNTINDYLESVGLARSQNTARTYKGGMNVFSRVLADHKLPPEKTAITSLTDKAMGWFLAACNDYAPATERIYLAAVRGFYEYLSTEELVEINLPRLKAIITRRSRRPGVRIIDFPFDQIHKLVTLLEKIPITVELPKMDQVEKLTLLRDRALILTLADTGLRIQEACNLTVEQIDWDKKTTTIIGKGNKQAIIRFSNRAIDALDHYITVRNRKKIPSRPLFARHDKAALKKMLPISTTTARVIVKSRVREYLGKEWQDQITPHSMRHYFVTVVLQKSGNLKLAQELARHTNIQTTQRYAHLSNKELSDGYSDIFN